LQKKLLKLLKMLGYSEDYEYLSTVNN